MSATPTPNSPTRSVPSRFVITASEADVRTRLQTDYKLQVEPKLKSYRNTKEDLKAHRMYLNFVLQDMPAFWTMGSTEAEPLLKTYASDIAFGGQQKSLDWFSRELGFADRNTKSMEDKGTFKVLRLMDSFANNRESGRGSQSIDAATEAVYEVMTSSRKKSRKASEFEDANADKKTKRERRKSYDATDKGFALAKPEKSGKSKSMVKDVAHGEAPESPRSLKPSKTRSPGKAITTTTATQATTTTTTTISHPLSAQLTPITTSLSTGSVQSLAWNHVPLAKGVELIHGIAGANFGMLNATYNPHCFLGLTVLIRYADRHDIKDLHYVLENGLTPILKKLDLSVAERNALIDCGQNIGKSGISLGSEKETLIFSSFMERVAKALLSMN